MINISCMILVVTLYGWFNRKTKEINKDAHRKRSLKRYHRKSKDPEFRKKEAERKRIAYHKNKNTGP